MPWQHRLHPSPALPTTLRSSPNCTPAIPSTRVESVVRRPNGRPFHVLTSAAFLPAEGDRAPLIERFFIDLNDRTQLEEQLRLARRLESAGRLAAEMSGEIDPLLAALGDASAPPAKPLARPRSSGSCSPSAAGRRSRPVCCRSAMRSSARSRNCARSPATASPSSFGSRTSGRSPPAKMTSNSCLSALVFAAAGSLPYGGTIVLETRSLRSGFDQRTELVRGRQRIRRPHGLSLLVPRTPRHQMRRNRPSLGRACPRNHPARPPALLIIGGPRRR